MFWISITSLVFATLLIKLGALSVVVAVLEFTLKSIVAVLVVLAGLLAWRKYGPLRLPWRKQ